mgnify:CR=1 FL=1
MWLSPSSSIPHRRPPEPRQRSPEQHVPAGLHRRNPQQRLPDQTRVTARPPLQLRLPEIQSPDSSVLSNPAIDLPWHLPRQSAQLLSIPLILSSTQLC